MNKVFNKTFKLNKSGTAKLTCKGYTINRTYFPFGNFKLVLKKVFSIKLFGYRLTLQKETFTSKIPPETIIKSAVFSFTKGKSP